MTTGKLCDDRIARPRAAFDAYATDYTAGMENPLKAVLGATADQFVELKLRWMLRRFPSLRAKHGMTRSPGLWVRFRNSAAADGGGRGKGNSRRL